MLTLFRISGTYHGADIAVGIPHALFSPFYDLLSNQFIQRFSIDLLILELSAGWIGCLHQDK